METLSHKEEFRTFTVFLHRLVPVVVCTLVLCMCVIVFAHDDAAYGESLSRKEALLQSAPGPRLIIVGGSGAASSIDSEILGKATDRTPVNMGVYAGVGMRFALNQVRDEVVEGDIVLIAPEYEMLQQPSTGDGFLLLEMLSHNPTQFFAVLTPRGGVAMLRAFPGWLRIQTIRAFTKIYDRAVVREKTPAELLYRLENMTPSGDLDTRGALNQHLDEESLRSQGTDFVRPRMDPKNLTLITTFVGEMEQRGAAVFVVLPAVPQIVQSNNLPAVRAQYTELENALRAERIIGTPGTFVFASDRFLDAIGHLTWRGKEERTALILDILRKHLADTDDI